MVVCPLAVLDNWAREFARFAPDIPVVTYYGTKEERAEIRRSQMVMDAVDIEYYEDAMKKKSDAAAAAEPPSTSARGKGKGKGKAKEVERDVEIEGKGKGRANDVESNVQGKAGSSRSFGGVKTRRGGQRRGSGRGL